MASGWSYPCNPHLISYGGTRPRCRPIPGAPGNTRPNAAPLIASHPQHFTPLAPPPPAGTKWGLLMLTATKPPQNVPPGTHPPKRSQEGGP